MSDKKVDLDEILCKFGLNQRYHIKLSILIIFAFITNSFYSANYVFVAEEVSYRCINQNVSKAYCNLKSNETCEEWIYDEPNSFVAEFGLGCQDWKRTTVGTVHSFGYMVGLLLVGPISDRVGRKIAIILTGILGGVFGILRSFAPWYLFYIAMEFLEAAIGDSCSPMYVLSLEFVPTKKRTIFVLITNLGYTIGSIIFALIAWSVPYWRTLLRVIYAPAFIFISYIFLCDESPRWLLTKGKKEAAIDVLEKAAKTNNITLDKCILEKLTCEEEKNVSFGAVLKDTFQSRMLRSRFFICLVWWTTSTFVSYGLTINSVSLAGNKYINYMLLAAVDIPASLIAVFILQHYKRKKPLIVFFLMGAVFCLAQPFMPSGFPWLSILLFMAGKMMSSFYFTITYLYTSELFPTYTRNSMHALCSSLGRIGSILAPQTPLLIPYWSGLPSFAFGLTALFAGLITFLAPDVGGDSLPDTVFEAQALGKQKASKEYVNKVTNTSKL